MAEIVAESSRLRKIKDRYGKSVMYRVAAGLSLRDALRMGSSYRRAES